jgi:hypothetical protein
MNNYIRRDAHHIVVFQGDDLRLLCTVRDQHGALIDISGATEVEWNVSEDAGGAAVITKTLGSGTALTSPTGFLIDVLSADTAGLSKTVYWPGLVAAARVPTDARAIDNSYYHQCVVTAASGKKYTALAGRLFVRRSTL